MNCFLQVLVIGKLVCMVILEKFWQLQKLSGGGSNFFFIGWDIICSDGYIQVGYDGGICVCVWLVYKGMLVDGYWVFVYLINGSVCNVWFSILVESMMVVVVLQEFLYVVLFEWLVVYVLDDDVGVVWVICSWLCDNNWVIGSELECVINVSGYVICQSLGVCRVLKVFVFNSELYLDLVNVWDSLVECYVVLGEKEVVDQFYVKLKMLVKFLL